MKKNKVIVEHPCGAVNVGKTAIANGMDPGTLRSRLAKMSLEEALEKPAGKYIGTSKSHPSEYWSWSHARRRVSCPKEPGWENYGGRGIRMCERWMNSFEAFLEDIGPKPGAEYSIERRDNDGDYCPENCYWATYNEQNSNKRTNVMVHTPWGVFHLAEACRRAGMNINTIFYRVKRRGITYEDALFNWEKHTFWRRTTRVHIQTTSCGQRNAPTKSTV